MYDFTFRTCKVKTVKYIEPVSLLSLFCYCRLRNRFCTEQLWNQLYTTHRQVYSSADMEMIPATTISSALAGLDGVPSDGMRVDGAGSTGNTIDLPHRRVHQAEEVIQQTPSIESAGNGQAHDKHAAEEDLVLGDEVQGVGNEQYLNRAAEDLSGGGADNTENGDMPPPNAPASMLYKLRASDMAKKGAEQNDDPFICSHLAVSAVTLFRMGKAKESKAVGQFAVDLLGEERWHEWLLKYMNEPPGEDDERWALPLLSDVATALREEDRSSSGFLSILIELMD